MIHLKLIAILFLSASSVLTTNITNHSYNQNHMQDSHGFANVNGITMYYEIYGEGRPLVLVHGGGSTIQSTFATIIPLLSKKYKVIALELQAHGRTSDRNAPESFEQDADDVAALLKYLSIEKADLMGFSNGGNTIMQVAIRHPQVAGKLVIASAFYKREGMMKGLFEGLQQATLADMPAGLKQAFLKVTNDNNKLQTMFEKDKQRMLTFKDWKEEDLARIKSPSLVIAGDHDVMTTAHTVELSQKISNAKLLIVPGNHGSYIGEQTAIIPGSTTPESVVNVISEFLDAN